MDWVRAFILPTLSLLALSWMVYQVAVNFGPLLGVAPDSPDAWVTKFFPGLFIGAAVLGGVTVKLGNAPYATVAHWTVAMTLLGYPEDSIGRLMTPSYVAVREDWTVRQVLDHIRTYGQDSETLDVIYVVDQQGLLVDDIRLRELLLTSPDNRARLRAVHFP